MIHANSAPPTTPLQHHNVRRVVELGCRAPSVHNTQPWGWRIDGPHLELRADRSRQLAASDPDGRNLTISCGAALHHAQVAAAGLGLVAGVERFPDGADPDLLAVITLLPGSVVTPAAAALLQALEHRVTDRRRFTSWPVPRERLEALASVAERWGARVFPLTGTSARWTTERLVDQAVEIQLADPRLVAEQRIWVGRSAGVERPRRPVDSSDAVLAVCTAYDDPAGWLDAGEAVSLVWLRATLAGFSVVPLSQVIEVQETREALRHDIFMDMAWPQLLLRVGWQEVSRIPLPRSPRRPFGDVVEGSGDPGGPQPSPRR